MLTRVVIPCPDCRAAVRVPTEYIGRQVCCNRCEGTFSAPRMVRIACPECGLGGPFRTEDLGRMIRCNRCDAPYVAVVADPGSAPSGTGAGPLATDDAPPTGRQAGGDGGDPLLDEGSPAGIGHAPAPSFAEASRSESANGLAEAAEAFEADPPAVDSAALAELGELREEADRLRAEAATLAAESVALREDRDERARREGEILAELVEARSRLDRQDVEADELRGRAAAAARLEDELRARAEATARLEEDGLHDRAEAEAASAASREDRADRSRREAGLLAELDEARSRLDHLGVEADALRGRAVEADRLEDELRARAEAMARLEEDGLEARAEAEAARREFAALLAHSSGLHDGLNEALAEIEAGPVESLINAREAERLVARIGALEAEVERASSASRAAEEDAARASRARDDEIARLRVEIDTLRAQAAAPAAVPEGRTVAVPQRIEPSEIVASTRRRPGTGLAVAPRPSRTSPLGANGSALHHDIALDMVDVREGSPGLEGDAPRGAVGDGATPAGPAPDDAEKQAEADRLKSEVIRLRTRGDLRGAEELARRVVDLTGEIRGERDPEYARCLGVLGSLQARQGDWAGARAIFEQLAAIYSELYGELHPRHLACLASLGEVLLSGGDPFAARALFERADLLGRRCLDEADPLALMIRKKLDGVRMHNPSGFTYQINS